MWKEADFLAQAMNLPLALRYRAGAIGQRRDLLLADAYSKANGLGRTRGVDDHVYQHMGQN